MVYLTHRELNRDTPAIDVSCLFQNSFVYLLMRDLRVVYVGQSQKLGARIETHRSDKKFDRVLAIPVDVELLNKVESALIRLIRPEYNRAGADSLATDEDRKLALQYGIHASESKVATVNRLKIGAFGPVVAVAGEFQGLVGYYDDDDTEEHECDSFYEETGIDMESLSSKAIDKICENHDCQQYAIVYFENWSAGYELVPHNELMALEDLSPESGQLMIDRLFPGLEGNHRDFAKLILGMEMNHEEQERARSAAEAFYARSDFFGRRGDPHSSGAEGKSAAVFQEDSAK